MIISLHQSIEASNNGFNFLNISLVYFSGIFLAYANFTMLVSNVNGITTETIDETFANEYLDNLVINALKLIRNIKKLPDCSVIYDYVSKL